MSEEKKLSRSALPRTNKTIVRYGAVDCRAMTVLIVVLFLLAASTHVSTTTRSKTCSHSKTILSCSPESLNADPCCTESAGLLLLTQLYNWNPGLGPSDSWTLHGLWPNFCNGSYPASCDTSREYTGIADTLKQKDQALLQYMQEFWRVCCLLHTKTRA